MGLLDLIEEDHRERPAAHLLGQLTALLVADIAGGAAEEPRDGVLLAVFGHVELDEGVLVAEEELGERLGELCLADARRPGEDKRPAGAARVLQAGAGAPDGLAQGPDGVIHANDALVQLGLHVEQPAGLLLGELENGNSGRGGQHLGDQLLVDLGDDVHVAGLPLLLAASLLTKQLLLVVAQARRLLEVLPVDRRLLLQAHLGDPVVILAQVRRCSHPADAQSSARLVDQVDRLVRQEAVVDIAVREVRGADESGVGDGDPVVGFIPVPQALEDLDGVRERGLGNLDRLEAALQRGVLLDVFPVLIQRRRADGLELAPGQHRLQDRRGVDRAFGRTGTDEGVDLIDEQDDVAAGADLLQDLLQAFLEVTAVAAAGHQRAEVEGVELLVLEGLGNIAAHDVLGQALDDGRLADAGLTDKHGVVLGAPREHLHDPLDLLFAPDDRVELGLASRLGQVAPELVEHQRPGRRALGLLAGGADTGGRALLALVAADQLDDLLAHLVQVGAELDEDLRGNALALADEAEQDVLGPDVVVAELQRLAQAQLEDLLGARGEGDVTRGRLLALADDLLDLLAHILQLDAEGLQRLAGNPVALVDQAEQDVFGPDVVVVEHPRFFLREDDHPAGPVGEPFKHGCS